MLTFNARLCAYLITGFVLFTIVGTVSHELGHFCAAQLLDYHASVNYGYTFYEEEITGCDAFFITLAGPLQTMLTGTIAFLLMLRYQRNFQAASDLNWKQWLLIFFSLFWMRQVFNCLHALVVYFASGQFPEQGDEIRLARFLDLHALSISLPTALAGACIAALVVFRFIPMQQRLTFICSALTGGVAGFYIWFSVAGPILMP